MKWTAFNHTINYIKHSLLQLQAIFDRNLRTAFNGRLKKQLKGSVKEPNILI